MTYVLLFLAGILAYIISTLSGGGGALMLLPIVGFYLSPSIVAPVVNLGNMIGRPVRLFLFWKNIQWKIVIYYVPSAIIGAIVGALIFVELKADWIQGSVWESSEPPGRRSRRQARPQGSTG